MARCIGRLTVNPILTRQTLSHLPSRQHNQEPRLVRSCAWGIGAVVEDLLLHLICDRVWIVWNELTTRLVEHLPEGRQRLAGISQRVQHVRGLPGREELVGHLDRRFLFVSENVRGVRSSGRDIDGGRGSWGRGGSWGLIRK